MKKSKQRFLSEYFNFSLNRDSTPPLKRGLGGFINMYIRNWTNSPIFFSFLDGRPKTEDRNAQLYFGSLCLLVTQRIIIFINYSWFDNSSFYACKRLTILYHESMQSCTSLDLTLICLPKSLPIFGTGTCPPPRRKDFDPISNKISFYTETSIKANTDLLYYDYPPYCQYAEKSKY
jgi:hypothetical protein